MISFKQYLTEAPIDPWDISWKKTYLEHIVRQDGYFYLPPTTTKKILGEMEIESFHGTTINGLRNLKAIQHTRKSVSSFTSLSHPANIIGQTFSGNYKEDVRAYDVLCKLSGELVVAGDDDIYSVPDEKGTRGVHFLFNGLNVNYHYPKSILIENLFKQFINDNPTLQYIKVSEHGGLKSSSISNYKSPWENYKLLKELKKENNQTSRLISAFFYKIQHEFYIFCKQFLIDNKEEIKEISRKFKHQQNESYNEVLIDKFTIKEIFIISTDPWRKDMIEDGLTKLNYTNKTVNFGKWVDTVDDIEIDR